MISRRRIAQGFAATVLSGFGTTAYGIGVEPLRLDVTRYSLRRPAPWPASLRLRVAVLTDIHACEPWMNAARIDRIVEVTNGLGADLIVLLGDYVVSQRFVRRDLAAEEWARPLGRLTAPLGVRAILGNHDWWEDADAMRRGAGPVVAGTALGQAGIRVYENEAEPFLKDGQQFWLAGLGDQLARAPLWRSLRLARPGIDDLSATLAPIPPDEPTILLAHEPDIFPRVPDRVSLTLSGHTHGGQIRFFGYSPWVPSRFGNRYAYGHIREQTDLIVSAGLGCSIAPLRLGIPPEIVLVDIAADGIA